MDQPCPAGTKVADIAPDPAETDPGPFTYAVVTGAESFTVVDTALNATVDLTGATPVGVTSTSAGGTSPEGSATITVGEAATGEGGEWSADDGYEDNPSFPPLPTDPEAQGYQYFLDQATQTVVPHARRDMDFVNARADKYSDITNVYWNDALLGPRPAQEIEDLARALAADAPRLNPDA